MKTTKTVCDVCSIEKGVTNHWFKATVTSGSGINPNTSGAPTYDTPPAFYLARPRFSYDGIGKDVCGQECATKLLQHWMATGTLETPATREPVPA